MPKLEELLRSQENLEKKIMELEGRNALLEDVLAAAEGILDELEYRSCGDELREAIEKARK